MIASCLSRKVWYGDKEFPVFPNIYIVFVGEPAVGKSLPAVKSTEILKFLMEVYLDKSGNAKYRSLVNISPDSTTLEQLFIELVNATRTVEYSNGGKKDFYTHASMSFCLGEEMGTLFRDKSNDLVRFLTQGYNCGSFKRSTKTQGKDDIANMCINFLGCCTPEWIQQNISNMMINEGFTSRVIFIWGAKPRHRIVKIIIDDEQRKSIIELKKHLVNIAKLFGEVRMLPDAEEWFTDWVLHKQDTYRINDDPKLKYYYGRKKVHLIKLAIVNHFSENTSMELNLQDFLAADKALIDIEKNMHFALQSKRINPIAEHADRLMSLLDVCGPMSLKMLVVKSFDWADEQTTNQAVEYLVLSGKIKPISGKYERIRI